MKIGVLGTGMVGKTVGAVVPPPASAAKGGR